MIRIIADEVKEKLQTEDYQLGAIGGAAGSCELARG